MFGKDKIDKDLLMLETDYKIGTIAENTILIFIECLFM